MATRMLIDARHPEETRVAVLQGNRIEEFDFESAEHKQIKGNIYLAKVTRVEPSLQAAFVDFGGNRHGFLAFSEIHPDYYQIPKADRDALLAEEAEAAAEEERLRAEEEEEGIAPGNEYDAEDDSGEALAEDFAENGVEEVDSVDKDDVATIEDGSSDDDNAADEDSDDDEAGESGDEDRGRARRGRRRQGKAGNDKSRSRAKQVDELRAKRQALRRRYKIQDVIQRRQVLLVQVVKEERGNKGAALTTYLSLAGRYTVLMPNSSSGGGISRKISSTSDRKRLKEMVSDLKLPKSMGLIVRTAGMSRTKPEIKRDFDYLARVWDEIREKTLASVAPALIHSDSDLIKRAIRDIYNKEIEEVVVEGEEGYKSAKAFMKLLMPSHARRVKAYSDPVPLFQRYGAEDQLRAMYDPMVQLKSGGYLIINPTEALVSIDINSGRSTKEHNIEQTALHTNLEAAREIARQLRLRDMAGLVVIDFIDMEYPSNVRKVEKAMKEALKNDRARIQIGRISSFGLMEMSRQRLRTGVLEATTRPCPHCDGTGLVRTASSAGLSALRLIEDEAAKGKGTQIRLAASTEAAIYLLNEKRADLVEIERRYGVSVEVVPEGENEGAKMSVSSSGPRPAQVPRFEPIIDEEDEAELPEEEASAEEEAEREPRQRRDTGENDEDGARRKKRRRRRGGRGRNRAESEDSTDSEARNDSGENGDSEDSVDSEARSDAPADEGDDGEARPKKRRRRGGRGRKRRGDGEAGADEAGRGESPDATTADDIGEGSALADVSDAAPEAEADPAEAPAVEAVEEAAALKPKRKRAARKPKVAEPEAEAAPEAVVAEAAPAGAAEDAPAAADTRAEKPKRKRAPRKAKVADPEPAETAEVAQPQPTPEAETEAPAKQAAQPAQQAAEAADTKPRKGWWSRTFGD
ncbi:MAG: ribonuclease E/G [Erythrobacter sp.]